MPAPFRSKIVPSGLMTTLVKRSEAIIETAKTPPRRSQPGALPHSRRKMPEPSHPKSANTERTTVSGALRSFNAASALEKMPSSPSMSPWPSPAAWP